MLYRWKTVKGLVVISTCLVGTVGVANVHAKEFDIKRNHIKYDGERYFVANSSAVKNGTYGDKKSPVTQQNYLFRHSDFPKVGRITSTPPQFAKSSSDTSLFHGGDVDVPVKLAELKVSSEVYARMVKDQKCSFVREYIADLGVLRNNLNASRSTIDYLKQKNSSRVVFDVIRAKSCMVSNKVIHDASVKAGVNLKSLGIKLASNNRTKGETEVNFKFGKDTVIGYKMLKMKWDKKRKNKRTKIVRFEDDKQSFN